MKHHRHSVRLGRLAVAVLSAWFISSSTSFAQLPPLEEEKKIDVVLTKSGIDEVQKQQIEFPEPEAVSLTTSDGVKLSATVYPGVLGKKTPPLILLHDLGGSSDPLQVMARWLQTNYGYAVIVPDLRGHGGSALPDESNFEPLKMKAEDFAKILNDVESCKRYLRDHYNDDGELNIDMLTIVAVGKMNIIAVEWSIRDWSFPVLNGRKQGQDVKQLVMISPESSYRGLRMALTAPLFSGKDFDQPLNVFLTYFGDDKQQQKEVTSIESKLMRGRGEAENAGVYVAKYSVGGEAMVDVDAFRSAVGEFVYFKIYQDANRFPWQVRGRD